MHEPDCRCHPAPTRPDISLAPEYIGAPASMAAGTLSVRLAAPHEEHDRVAVLRVRGEIDLGTAPMLRDVLLPVFELQTGPVVIDLSMVSFMDSSGVHLLTETLRRLAPQNRALTLVCHEEGQVHGLLALVGGLDVVTVYRSGKPAGIADDDVLRREQGRSDGAHARNAPTGPGADLMAAIH